MIRESGYEHPHGYLKLEVPGKTWLVVLAPPSRMERRGLPPTEADELRAERITVNGKTVELR